MSAARHVQTGEAAVDRLAAETGLSHAEMMLYVRYVGSAMIGIAILVVVLVEVFSLDAIAGIDSSAPFGGIVESLQSTGSAALGLLVIGLLVAAASGVMRWFGGGF